MQTIKIILILLSLIPLNLYANSTPSVIMITDLKERQEITTFDCRSKIYAYIMWDKIPSGQHILEAYWYNPKGIQQEYTKYEFSAPVSETWVWLKLNGSRGSKLLSSVDPQVGYEKFIGEWKVKIYIDSNYLSTKSFFILC